MDDQFAKVKTGGGGLRLKGEKKKAKKHKSGKRKREDGDAGPTDKDKARKEFQEDGRRHGGWWAAEKYHEVTGAIAIQFPNNCYMKAMDNGKFVLGAPHGDGEGPDPEEIMMAMRIGGEGGGGKVSFKSGFDRFLRLNKQEQMHGVSEAVGRLEEFEPVWQDGQCAVLGPNNKFLTADEDDLIVCSELKAGEGQIVRIRSNREKEDLNKKVVPVEERGSVADVELKFTKKFMKFQDHKYKARLDYESQGQILIAKDQGNLHETLLDRREKIKSDRMCK
jgi:protein FRG1